MAIGQAAFGLGLVLTFKDLASRGMQSAQMSLKALGTQSTVTAKQFDRFAMQMKVGAGLMLAGGGLVAAMGKTISIAADYEHKMAKFQAISGATNEVLEDMRSNFLTLSATLPISAEEMAVVATGAARMGIFAKQGQAGTEVFTVAIIELSRIMEEVPIDELSMKTARMMGIFHLAPEQLQSLTSALAKTAFSSAATSQEILNTTERAQGFGKAMGWSAAQVIGFAGAVADAGVSSQIGASGMMKIISRMGESIDEFAQFVGVSSKEFTQIFQEDNPKALRMFVDQLKTMGGKTVAQIGILDNLGLSGLRTERVIFGLTQLQTTMEEKIAASTKAFEESTFAHEQFMKLTLSLTAKLDTFIGTLKNVAISFGSVLIPAAKKVLDLLIALGSWFFEQPKFVHTFIATTVALTGVFLLATGAALLLGGAFGILKMYLPILIQGFKGIVGVMAPVFLWVGLLAGALFLLGTAYRKNLGGFRDFVERVVGKVVFFFKALREAIRGFGSVSEDTFKKLGPLWGIFTRVAAAVLNLRNFIWGFQGALWQLQEPIARVVEVFKNFVIQLGVVFFGSQKATKGVKDNRIEWNKFGTFVAESLIPILNTLAVILQGVFWVWIQTAKIVRFIGNIFSWLGGKISGDGTKRLEFFSKALGILAGILTTKFAAGMIFKIAFAPLWGVLKIIPALITGLWGAASAAWGFTAALLTNPITWIVIGVVALIAGLVLLVKNWDKVVAVFMSGVAAIGNFFSSLAAKISNFFSGLIEKIPAPLRRFLGLEGGGTASLRVATTTGGARTIGGIATPGATRSFQQGGEVGYGMGLPEGTPVPVTAEVGEIVIPRGAAPAPTPTGRGETKVVTGNLKIEIPLILDGREIHRVVKELNEFDLRRSYSPPVPVGRGVAAL